MQGEGNMMGGKEKEKERKEGGRGGEEVRTGE